VVVNGAAPAPRTAAWQAYTEALGIPAAPAVGDRLATTSLEPAVRGTVERVTPTMITVLTDEPAPGVVFVAAEGDGEQVSLSLYGYLYGSRPTEPSVAWPKWMDEHFPVPAS
jgi:hypothetical protein